MSTLYSGDSSGLSSRSQTPQVTVPDDLEAANVASIIPAIKKLADWVKKHQEDTAFLTLANVFAGLVSTAAGIELIRAATSPQIYCDGVSEVDSLVYLFKFRVADVTNDRFLRVYAYNTGSNFGELMFVLGAAWNFTNNNWDPDGTGYASRFRLQMGGVILAESLATTAATPFSDSAFAATSAVAPSYSTGWGDDTGNTVYCRRGVDGVVRLDGYAKYTGGGTEQVIATVPAGYRPIQECIFWCFGYNSFAGTDSSAFIKIFKDGAGGGNDGKIQVLGHTIAGTDYYNLAQLSWKAL